MSIFRINTNTRALSVQRQLSRGSNTLADAQERLSSGKRINTASDDAAGLAISQGQSAQIRGLNRAVRNSQDGISLIQTAEGALDETQNALQRIRELAVQSANDTLTGEDREKLQSEVNQLAVDVQRIANETQFNNKTLLDGSVDNSQLQVGANQGESVSFAIDDMGTTNEGLSLAGDGVIKSEQIDQPIVGVYQGDSNADTGNDAKLKVVETSDGRQALELQESVELVSGNGKINQGTIIATQNEDNPRIFDTKAVGGLSGDNKAISANVIIQTGSVFTLDDIGTQDGSFKNSKSVNTLTDVSAQDVDLLNFNKRMEAGHYSLQLTNPDDFSTAIMELRKDGIRVAARDFGNLSNGLVNSDGEVVATLNDDQIEIDGNDTIANGTANGPDEVFAFTSTEGERVTFGGPDVTETENASQALGLVDLAIGEVSDQRSDLGALQNRLETTIESDKIASGNLQEARGRIEDADVAEESVKQARENIRVQAGTSVLGQINVNQQLLSLQLLA